MAKFVSNQLLRSLIHQQFQATFPFLTESKLNTGGLVVRITFAYFGLSVLESLHYVFKRGRDSVRNKPVKNSHFA